MSPRVENTASASQFFRKLALNARGQPACLTGKPNPWIGKLKLFKVLSVGKIRERTDRVPHPDEFAYCNWLAKERLTQPISLASTAYGGARSTNRWIDLSAIPYKSVSFVGVAVIMAEWRNLTFSDREHAKVIPKVGDSGYLLA